LCAGGGTGLPASRGPDTEQGFKKIRYNMKLRMHMIQAIKELKMENDVLRGETKELKV